MLAAYLNHTAEHRRMTGTDAHGQPLYSAAERIPCRRTKAICTETGASGSVTVSRDVYYTDRNVDAGDTLDGRAVMAVSDLTMLGGAVVGHKCVMS